MIAALFLALGVPLLAVPLLAWLGRGDGRRVGRVAWVLPVLSTAALG